jgi:hypothetical protein
MRPRTSPSFCDEPQGNEGKQVLSRTKASIQPAVAEPTWFRFDVEAIL